MIVKLDQLPDSREVLVKRGSRIILVGPEELRKPLKEKLSQKIPEVEVLNYNALSQLIICQSDSRSIDVVMFIQTELGYPYHEGEEAIQEKMKKKLKNDSFVAKKSIPIYWIEAKKLDEFDVRLDEKRTY